MQAFVSVPHRMMLASVLPRRAVQRGALRFRMGQVQLALADFDCAVNTLRITEENNPGENSAALASALHQVGVRVY